MSKSAAIIGSACRFPGGADSPSKLWELLKSPRDVLSEFPSERLNLWSFYHENGEHHGSTDVPNKSYLLSEDIRLFDASFFRISPQEADAMDPQQRLLLETVYEALESAGCTLQQVQKSMTSVFAGLMNQDYAHIQARDVETMPTHSGTGSHQSILSNRISYFLDVKGPSMTIDTACSGSLVALHQAMHSLRSGESDMAIVVGANLLMDPTSYVAESKLHMLSPTSRSRMWDASADGYARGEGLAAVVLKPLDRAVSDGDHIECIVRGTAVNQDGRTAGITAPSAEAHTALIRQAYRDAGLDPLLDRCQFFEAHGTGTRAGDPVEARGVRDAFFPAGQEDAALPGKLLIGSIKTVVGHLEGCAGLAGVLKASLAMRNRTIPPNMHFNELNPAIAPLYDRLEIPTQAREWPPVAEGAPLRASVNSFGFGGTNAHVVLELPQEYIAQDQVGNDTPQNERFVGPLLLSSNSRPSLVRSVEAYADYLRNNSAIRLDDLTWTLQFKRTQFGNSRAFFSGATRQKLLSYMDSFVASEKTTPQSSGASTGAENDLHTLIDDSGPAVLGVFTGQGAQWPSMGRNLIIQSPLFRASIARCEASLAALGADAPQWSLEKELLAEGEASRVAESALAHPLSLACQVGLVDLLRASGVYFRCVVGHSSGEIAAAYAANIISAEDAIRIAYYRGFHSHLASGPGGQNGSMVAAGLSFENAEELCAMPQYAGRIVVAAANSPTTVTLSGDEDAIDDVKAYLDSQKIFARKLNVEKAYHSHHMEPCASAYLSSLEKCDIQVHRPRDGCIWVSSLRGDADLLEGDESGSLTELRGPYWVENLVRPVLFAPAVECALWKAGPFDIVAEVGVHPALKGPTTQIFKTSLGNSLPYFSVMRRGDYEVEAFSGGLGYFWQHFGSAASIDFAGYRQAFLSETENARTPCIVKGLPSYRWDHGRIHWKESRISHSFRLHDRRIQEVLGRRALDDTPDLLRWRNILRPAEIPWVRGHVYQGQIVFPGASYIAAIIEAIKASVGGERVTRIEISDLRIPKAVVLHESKSIELITSLRILHRTAGSFTAEFSFSTASADSATNHSDTTCYGRVDVHIGELSSDKPVLPLHDRSPPNLNPVDIEAFYSNLRTLGIDYQGLFRPSQSLQRTLGYASSLATWDGNDLGSSYSLHPAILDVSFHAILAAFASPSSGQMWSMLLPVGMRRVTIDLDSLRSLHVPDVTAGMSAQVTASSSRGVEGDVQVIVGSKVSIQVEGVELQATGDPQADADRILFSTTRWDSDISSGIVDVVLEKQPNPAAEEAVFEAMGRTALFYYRSMLEEISPREAKGLAWHLQMFWQSARHWVEEVRAGRHSSVKPEWLEDSREEVWAQVGKCQDSIDIMMMRALGNHLPSIMRGGTQPLEVMMENNMLSRFYVEGHALDGMNDCIARTLAQITHRHPRARILEIGAGSAGTTRKVLRAIANSFGHYTFTDISSGFFEKAADSLSQYTHKMSFRVCNIEKDPAEEGFEKGAYDVIVAANVLHATRNLAETMRNVRSFLKPGGYLVMMEITGDLLRLGFIMGALPAWWVGPQIGDEGRQWAPGISPVDWDNLLQRTGFSGIMQIASDSTVAHKHYMSTIVSQAVDEQFTLLQNPLSSPHLLPSPTHRVLLLGGETLPIARIANELKSILNYGHTPVDVCTRLESVVIEPNERVSLISLLDLDQPLFIVEMTATRLKKLQDIVSASDTILWATTGSRGAIPSASMFTGLSRALRTERTDLALQVLDFSRLHDAKATMIAHHFLRLILANHKDYVSKSMLWTTEPEISLEGEKLLIPRVCPEPVLNETYNASRRKITKEITSLQVELEIESREGVLTVIGEDPNVSRRLSKISSSGHFIVDVQLSVAFSYPTHSVFLCYGSVRSSDKKVFVLSSKNASVVLGTLQDSLQVDAIPPEREAQVVEAVAGQLVVRSLASTVPRRGAVLVHEPPSQCLATAIQFCNLWENRKVYYSTCRSDTQVPESWILINPSALSSSIRHSIPRDITSVINFAPSHVRHVGTFVPAGLPIQAFEPALIDTDSQAWANAYADALQAVNARTDTTPNVVPIQATATSHASMISYPAVVDWIRSPEKTISVEVKPLTASGIFSSTKTHLLVGLNGELGQSICGHMVRNGARHVAIASRRGEVNLEWLESMRHDYQADIRLYKMDVTSQKSVSSTLDQLKRDMPPIGGVANGAMVLHDNMFPDMDVDSWNGTLRPKVTGSKLLDEHFSTPDPDYFVLFSSVASVGNNGIQSNYSAANLFMESLVSNRRARGLAGSVIHVGVVIDVGYVARQDRKLAEHLRKQGYMLTSEADALFLFTEGVLASPADSNLCANIVMGLEPFHDDPDVTSRPPWYTDPRLSQLIMEPESATGVVSRGTSNAMGMSEKLDEARSAQEALELVQEAVCMKLEALMQLDAGSVNIRIPLLDMGFDSLLAVEVRTWVFKQVRIDIPVLRFLDGATVLEICEDIATQYLEVRDSGKENESVTVETQSSCASRPAPSAPDSTTGGSFSSPTIPESSGDEAVPDIPGTPLTSQSTLSKAFDHLEQTHDLKSQGKVLQNDVQPGKSAQTNMREVSRVDAMSSAQSRLWFLNQYLDDPTTCNVTVSYAVSGALDVSQLRNAIATVVAHHSSFRTCFYTDEETGTPMQGLMRTLFSPNPLKYVQSAGTSDIQREFDALRNREWDLESGDTFAATLLSTNHDTEHVLIFGYHHIIMDGVSWYVFLRDLEQAYTLQPLGPQRKLYMDAAAEQNRLVETGALESQIRYWKDVHAKLPDVFPLLPSASARRRRALRRYRSHTCTKRVSSELVSKIKNSSKSLRVTTSNFYLAALQVLFCNLVDIDDLSIGVTDVGRRVDGINDTIGCFLNILPLRLGLNRQALFADMVRSTSKHVLEGRSNGDVPIDVILDHLKVPREVSSSPLFQVLFNYRVGAVAEVGLGNECHMTVEAYRDAESPFDLVFGVFESGDGTCGLQVIAQSYLYDRDVAESLLDTYYNLLDTLSSDPSRMVQQYALPVEPKAIQKGITTGKGRRQTWDWPETLSKRVDDMIAHYRDDTAVIDPNGSLNYGELDENICLVTSIIQKEGMPQGSVIAVLCEPSADLIVSMLAILRMGHVYVPLDPKLPRERHVSIIADCEPALLLCHADTLESALSLKVNPPIVNLTTLVVRFAASGLNRHPDISESDKPAVILYTSGSTGKPKGTQLNHAGFLNHLALKTAELSLQRETVLQQSSFGFDMSLTQVFCALANGGTLVIAPNASRGDPIAISKLMLDHGVTFTITTPSEYAMWLRYAQPWLRKCTSWKHACMGGEVVTQQLIRAFSELMIQGLQLTNCYGPTETSLAVTFERHLEHSTEERPDHAVVGIVLPNYSVYILDETTSQPVPLGFPGEICVGGAGVALGYLNQPSTSSTKFVQDPFAAKEDLAKGWSRMFKTGDRGRLRADGSLVFMGRRGDDTTIKLRGLRIDLEEVANTMLHTYSDVMAEAVVTLRGEDHEQMLVAHVVIRSEQVEQVDAEKLRLLAYGLPLPAYMRPSLVVSVDTLPRTTNGKLDRKAIEAMELPRLENPLEGGGEKLSLEEGELSLLWDQVLGQSMSASRANLKPSSDFFMVGGSSLLLIQLQGAIKETLGLSVSITQLYQASTLSQMAVQIHAKKKEGKCNEDIDWEKETEPPEFSPSQIKAPSKDVRGSRLEVMLTGAHTFLGAEILKSLLHDKNVARIHCIALPKTASKIVRPSTKIACYPGNLYTDSLGLTPDDIAFLQPRLACIIHADSVGHCLNNYSSVRAPNLGSLRFLVDLALPLGIPLHLISSNRVTLLAGQHALPPLSVARHAPPSDGSEGLTASKWASEQLLRRVAENTGLNVTVHRPCAVVGSDAPSEDALNALLRSAVAQNSVPRFKENFAGFLDFAPVSAVASNIVRKALRKTEVSTSEAVVNEASADDVPSFTIVHHSSGVKTPIAEFRSRMEKLHRRDFEEVDITMWLDAAIEAGMDPLISTYLEAIVEKDEVIAFPYLGEPVASRA